MKSPWLGFVAALSLSVPFLQAQVYGPANRYTRRVPPQQVQMRNNPRAPVQTNAVPQQPTSIQQAPTAPPAMVSTNRLVNTQAVVRFIQPRVDPEKARAAKEEATRKTIEFQKKRAEEGSESAQYELGVRYFKGDGVEKDEALGRKWLLESAKNGFGPATKKLEDLERPAKPPEETKPREDK